MSVVSALMVKVFQTPFDQAASYNNIPLNMVNGSEEYANWPVTRSMQIVSPASSDKMMLKTATAPGMCLTSAMGFSRPSG